MLFFLVLALLCSGAHTDDPVIGFSYSPAVGIGTGISFATEGKGRISAIRVWERPGSAITGLQLCYDHIWAEKIGPGEENLQEMYLYDNEIIIQVSGKHNSLIFQLIFVTSRGRSLIAGIPTGSSFNFYPAYDNAGLRLLSGRYSHFGITALGAHWGAVSPGVSPYKFR